MSEKLKPCPRCGSRKRLAVEQTTKVEWRQKCNRCQFSAGTCASKEEARVVWNALPRKLRWTKATPTTLDFYWNRDGRLLRIGEILEISGALWCHFAGESEPQLLELIGGEWAGPIPEPEE